MTSSHILSRRRFLKHGASLAAGSAAIPYFVPSGALAAPDKPGANDRVTVGYIGAGGRANLLMDQMPGGSQIVAVCDCDLPRAEAAAKKHGGKWKVHQDYRKMLEQQDMDAVIVPVTDHGRVLPCVHACQAGKDIYAEKPLTVYISEGRGLVDAVRKHKRVFQVGSQQRSMEMNRFACEFVRNGGIGKVHTVLGINYSGVGRYTGLPEQPIPQGLDWDMWCGPTDLRPYNSKLHRSWMGWRSYSGGQMTNWGAHGLDQVQWALSASHSGPVEVWPASPGRNSKLSMRYANGVLLRLELEKGPYGGAIFVGDRGKIEINRNKFTTNPPDLAKDPPPREAQAIWEGPGWQAKLHIKNWLDCVKTRELPTADVEIGHRSITVCHLANIARWIGRKLRWDPETETFPGDDEANAYLDRPRRKGYELPDPL